jgi:hypothetical protein
LYICFTKWKREEEDYEERTMNWVKEHLLQGGSVEVQNHVLRGFPLKLTQISRDPLVHTYMHTCLLHICMHPAKVFLPTVPMGDFAHAHEKWDICNV